jgi:hypothetical protein
MPAEFLEAASRFQSHGGFWSFERGTRRGKRSPQGRLNLAQRDCGCKREKRQACHGKNGCGCLGVRMAGASRGCRSHTVAKHCGHADQDDGSTDERLGGASQIAEPGIAFGNVVETKILAGPRDKRGDEPSGALDATCGTVAASMDGHDGSLEQAPLNRTGKPRLTQMPARLAVTDGNGRCRGARRW